jgi:hypothetical protein
MKLAIRTAMLVAGAVLAPTAFAQAPAGAGTKDAGQPAVVPVAAPVGDHTKPPRNPVVRRSVLEQRHSPKDADGQWPISCAKDCRQYGDTV